jgi:O-antigen chain-terminating methyltransferase
MPGSIASQLSIDEFMERVRAEAWRQSSLRPEADPPVVGVLDTGRIEHVLGEARALSQPREKYPNSLRRLPFSGIPRVRRAILRWLNLLFSDQRLLSTRLLDAVAAIPPALQRLAGFAEQQRAFAYRLQGTAQALKHDLDAVQERLAGLASRLDSMIDAGRSTSEGLANLQGHLGGVQGELTALQERVQGLEGDQGLSRVRMDLALQRRALTDLASRLGSRAATRQEEQRLEPPELSLSDELYVAFEDAFRGSRELISQRLRVYLPVVAAAGAGTPEAPVVDLACGRGEWLDILRAAGQVAKGVDLNANFVEQCTARALDVVRGDALEFLRSLPDASAGAVTAFQFIEHLTLEDVRRLLDQSFRVLTTGGVAIFETPNPENVSVLSNFFYLDPTHRRPLPSPLLKFLAEASGFAAVEVKLLNPLMPPPETADSAIARWFAHHVCGAQDYAIIARRPEALRS